MNTSNASLTSPTCPGTNTTSNASLTSPTCPGTNTLFSFNTINMTTGIELTWISFQVINGVAIPVTFAINLLIMLVIIEKENLRTVKSNVLLVSLALSDLLVSVIVQPINVWLFNCFFRDGCKVPCEVALSITDVPRFLVLLSLKVLTMVSLDRYFAIQRPFLYCRVTVKNVVIAVIFSWISLAVSITLVCLFRNTQINRKYIFETVLTSLGIVVTSYCSLKVQIVSYRQIREINAQAAAFLSQATEEQKKEQKKRFQECKKTVTLCMLVFSTFVMYCSFIVVMIVGRLVDHFNFAIAMPIVTTFISLQSLVNPLITLRLSYIRKPVMQKIRKLFGISAIGPMNRTLESTSFRTGRGQTWPVSRYVGKNAENGVTVTSHA